MFLDDEAGSILERISAADGVWSIHPTSGSALEIDPAGDGLYARVREDPTSAQGMIQFYCEPDSVGFSFVAPPDRFEHVDRLLEIAFRSPSTEYILSIDFQTFRSPNAKTETPTWTEFVGGMPYFFRKFELTLKHSNRSGNQ
jgi:hypothetical protein